MLDKESFKWLIDEFRSMQRDLTIWEMRQQLNELNELNDELTDRNQETLAKLKRATELAERLAADTSGIAELQRQLAAQAKYISELEKQVEQTEFKRGILESEFNGLATRYETLYQSKQELEARLFDLESPKMDSEDEESNDNEHAET
jgi:chromosome segregation ATPase